MKGHFYDMDQKDKQLHPSEQLTFSVSQVAKILGIAPGTIRNERFLCRIPMASVTKRKSIVERGLLRNRNLNVVGREGVVHQGFVRLLRKHAHYGNDDQTREHRERAAVDRRL